MTETIDSLGSKMDHLVDRYDEHERAICRIDTSLRGNGVPGISSRVRALERAHKDMKKLMWIGMGGVAALLGNLGMEIFQHLHDTTQ